MPVQNSLTRGQHPPSVSPLHLSILCLLSILVLAGAISPAHGSSAPVAGAWEPSGGNLDWQAAPVCHATDPFFDPWRAWDPFFGGPIFWGSTHWGPTYWGPTFGGYSPYGTCSFSTTLWGSPSYFSTPLLYVDPWRGYRYPPPLANRWNWAWRTAWMPWYSPFLNPFPLYCPPHARSRTHAVQASTVVDRPVLDGAAGWTASPQAQAWNAVFAERREALPSQGLFPPLAMPRPESGASSLLTDKPGIRETARPTPGVRQSPFQNRGPRSFSSRNPSSFSSSPRATAGSPPAARAPVQRSPSRAQSDRVERPRPQRE